MYILLSISTQYYDPRLAFGKFFSLPDSPFFNNTKKVYMEQFDIELLCLNF